MVPSAQWSRAKPPHGAAQGKAPPRGCTGESPPTGQVLTEQAAIFSAIGLAAQGPGTGGCIAPKNERTL